MRDVAYGSVLKLGDAVSELLTKGDVDQALKVLHDFVERIITEPLCTSHVLGSRLLDKLCQSIGSACLENIGHKTSEIKQDKPIFVYIVTKLQKSGGHTRVIEDFIKARGDGAHVILSTELDGKSDIDYLNNSFLKLTDVFFESAPKENYEKRLGWLQERLICLGPEKVYLFNNHQDSVAVAAIQPDMNLDAYFYHHGDHHLCLGVYLSHLKHIDIHPMGYHTCRDELGVDNIYLPLTVEDKGARPNGFKFLGARALTTCTAGRSNKIEIPYFVSYIEIVPELLKSTGGRHIHIGRLSPWALFRIKCGLQRNSISLDRFVYTPWVPSVWKALHEHQVDLYVASFPYGGGLTLIEAMGAGIPVALHRHIFSRVLSGIELAYPGAFSWRQPEELLNYCASVTAQDLEKAGDLGRKQFLEFHANEHLCSFLNESGDVDLKPKGFLNRFDIAADEWALWMERQMSFKRLISRMAYRAFKRIRSAW